MPWLPDAAAPRLSLEEKPKRIHNCTKTMEMFGWLMDTSYLVKLSNCLTSHSQTQVSIFQSSMAIQDKPTVWNCHGIAPFPLRCWSPGRKPSTLSRCHILCFTQTLVDFPRCPISQILQGKKYTNSRCVYKILLTPPNVPPSKKYLWNPGSFCVCLICFDRFHIRSLRLHVRTHETHHVQLPSSMISIDFNVDFNVRNWPKPCFFNFSHGLIGITFQVNSHGSDSFLGMLKCLRVNQVSKSPWVGRVGFWFFVGFWWN